MGSFVKSFESSSLPKSEKADDLMKSVSPTEEEGALILEKGMNALSSKEGLNKMEDAFPDAAGASARTEAKAEEMEEDESLKMEPVDTSSMVEESE